MGDPSKFRAKNDWWNSIYAGAFSGAFLARNTGLKSMFWGAIGFAAFSGAIDTYIRCATRLLSAQALDRRRLIDDCTNRWDSPDEDA